MLTISDKKILLDCGCNENVDSLDFFEKVAQAAIDVDYIFVSHASHMMIGALPYLYKKGVYSRA